MTGSETTSIDIATFGVEHEARPAGGFSSILDWEPLDAPNPLDMPPRSINA